MSKTYLVERAPDVFDDVVAERMDILASGALVFSNDTYVFATGELARRDGNHVNDLVLAFAPSQWISVVPSAD